MPERDEREDEDARGEDISRPPKRDIYISIRTFSIHEDWSLARQSPDDPEIVTSMPAFPKAEC